MKVSTEIDNNFGYEKITQYPFNVLQLKYITYLCAIYSSRDRSVHMQTCTWRDNYNTCVVRTEGIFISTFIIYFMKIKPAVKLDLGEMCKLRLLFFVSRECIYIH